MYQPERKTKEFLRDKETYCVDDACRYARDIMLMSFGVAKDEEFAAAHLSWQTRSCNYSLCMYDKDSEKANYTFNVDDKTLGVQKIYSFPDIAGKLIVFNLKYSEHRIGDKADDVPDMIDYLSTNPEKIARPTMSHEGDRCFETIAARYALSELLENGQKSSNSYLLSDSNRRNQMIGRAIEQALEQGVSVDGQFYPYTRSKSSIKYLLDRAMLQQGKTDI